MEDLELAAAEQVQEQVASLGLEGEAGQMYSMHNAKQYIKCKQMYQTSNE